MAKSEAIKGRLMGLGKGKIEKGSGGKRGQSGKENHVTHQEEKEAGRRRRRLDGKKQEQTAKKDLKASH